MLYIEYNKRKRYLCTSFLFRFTLFIYLLVFFYDKYSDIVNRDGAYCTSTNDSERLCIILYVVFMFPLRRWTQHKTNTSGEKSVMRASFNGFFDRVNCTMNLTGIENFSIFKCFCKSRLDFITNLRC